MQSVVQVYPFLAFLPRNGIYYICLLSQSIGGSLWISMLVRHPQGLLNSCWAFHFQGKLRYLNRLEPDHSRDSSAFLDRGKTSPWIVSEAQTSMHPSILGNSSFTAGCCQPVPYQLVVCSSALGQQQWKRVLTSKYCWTYSHSSPVSGWAMNSVLLWRIHSWGLSKCPGISTWTDGPILYFPSLWCSEVLIDHHDLDRSLRQEP